MFLSDILNTPFKLNQDPNSDGFDFSQIKPSVFNNVRKVVFQGKEFKVNDQNILEPFIKTTKTPQVTISGSINENDSLNGSFVIEDGANVNIWSDKGVVSSVDTKNNTFTYLAPDITDDTDTIDTLYVNATKVGELQSDTLRVNINVIYVPIAGDGVISNANFESNELENDGWEY